MLDNLRFWTSAEERAERCLRAHLSPRQLDEYLGRRAFQVRGSKTGYTYLIGPSTMGNVRCYQTGMSYCVVSRFRLLLPDHMLMQKIYLETNEELFLQTAGRALMVMPTCNLEPLKQGNRFFLEE